MAVTDKINLADSPWKFRLCGNDHPDINDVFNDTINLPSTVSAAEKAPLTDERSDGFLTDPRRFEGFAVYERTVDVHKDDDCDVFLVMERTRTSSLYINGSHAGTQNSLCAPHRYDITGYVTGEPLKITVVIDNISCPVPGGHMTSQDTQTNWLGITGDIYIEYREKLRVENIRIFPDPESSSVTVKGKIQGGGSCCVTLSVDGFAGLTENVSGEFEIAYKMENAVLWSEHSPVCYTMKIQVGRDEQFVAFGMRKFSVSGHGIMLNGEKIFLRGKHDGMIFPLTGAAPTDKKSWLRVMSTAKAHGINHYRFHTCCPPEAAFYAADELGIYMEPELPFWGTVEEELTEGQQYLVDEGFRILDAFGNHPSFFALSLGNELWGSDKRLNAILGNYKAYDSRPLYTQGSNNFQFWPRTLTNEDFFVGVRCSADRLFRGSYAMCDAPQGHIQTASPNTNYNYNDVIRPRTSSGDGDNSVRTIEIQYGTGVKTVTVDSSSGELIPEIPVVSHEVGQYFMYPNYEEKKKYTGVLKPYNYEIFRERLEKAGLLHLADKYFKASGKFAADLYKMEIETALRSKELSGFQLLDIQDFTGQGTAVVGILDPFMDSKGVISPENWRRFCSDRVILGCFPKFVYSSGENVSVEVMLYTYTGAAENFTKAVLELNGVRYELSSNKTFKNGVFSLGTVDITMPEVKNPENFSLNITCGNSSNSYTFTVFPETETVSGYVTDWETARNLLEKGENVLLFPDDIPEENTVEGTYCTDFWNYPMFRSISESMKKPLPVGTLGILADNRHPALSEFPSDICSSPQWYDVVTDSVSAILDGSPIEPIVRVIDNCERNHSLGLIFEMRVLSGKLLVCTAGLHRKTDSLPCRWLLRSLTDHISSDKFQPSAEVSVEYLDRLFIGN